MENQIVKMIFDKQLDMEVLSLFGRMGKIPSHFHDYYEIGFIKHGNRRVVCQNEEYVIGENDLMVFNPNDSHTCIEMEKEALDFRCFHLSSQRMKALTLECVGYEAMPYFTPQIIYHSDIISQIKELHNLIIESSDDNLQKEELFYLVIGDLVSEYSKGVNHQEVESSLIVERACTYIEKHYKENITLSDLCSYTGFSKYHFIRMFTREKGISPHRFIESIKTTRAKDLLKNGMDIIEITFLLGFSSQSHFTNFFKKNTGVTPKQYKRIYEDLYFKGENK